MILTCPACATQYRLKDGAIPPEGRQVRCAACKHKWHQDRRSGGERRYRGRRCGRKRRSGGAGALAGRQRRGRSRWRRRHFRRPAAGRPLQRCRTAHRQHPGDRGRGADDRRQSGSRRSAVTAMAAMFRDDNATGGEAIATPPPPRSGTIRAIRTSGGRSWLRRDPGNARRGGAAPRRWLGGSSGWSCSSSRRCGFLLSRPAREDGPRRPCRGGRQRARADADHRDRQRLASGNELLAMSGRVINSTDREQDVPPIQAELRDQTGRWSTVDHRRPSAIAGARSDGQLQQRRSRCARGWREPVTRAAS